MYIPLYSESAIFFRCIFSPFFFAYSTFILTSDAKLFEIIFTTLKAS